MIKGATLNKGMFQKDGVTLLASGVQRYIDTIIPPIRMAIDALSGRPSVDASFEEQVI